MVHDFGRDAEFLWEGGEALEGGGRVGLDELLVDYRGCCQWRLLGGRFAIDGIFGGGVTTFENPIFELARCDFMVPFGQDVDADPFQGFDEAWHFAHPEAIGSSALVELEPASSGLGVVHEIRSVL